MKNISRTLRWLLLLAPLWFASVLMADETDLYYAQNMSANPNILFLLDNSGSMEYNKIGTETRMKVLQNVFTSVMSAVPSNLNIGLMRYGGHGEDAASGVSFPVKPVDLDKDGNGSAWDIIQSRIDPGLDNLPNPSANQPVRSFLQDVGNNWSAQGYTPIVDALYEASRYYRGEDADWGRLTADHVRAAHPSTYTGTLTWNPNAGCSTPTDCVQDWGECWATVVPDSCHSETRDVCNWGVINNNGCCWVSTGVDESGNATGGYCSSNTCENYGCLDTPHPGTVQVCQQYTCDGAVEGTATYISPIQYECQSNYLVLMSDGKPEYPATWDTPDSTAFFPPSMDKVKDMIAGTCTDGPNGYNSGTCGPELTKYLSTHDQSTAVDGDQFVQTFTIGFGLSDVNATNYLKALASVSDGALAANDEKSLKLAFEDILKQVKAGTSSKLQLSGAPAAQVVPKAVQPKQALAQNKPDGELKKLMSTPLAVEGFNKQEQQVLSSFLNPLSYWRTLAVGGFFEATDTASLLDAFNSIINKVTASASSFSSPSYQVDTNTLLAHNEYVYIPVFDRNNLPRWPGNLKKFKRDSSGQIVNADGTPALNAKGEFLDTAKDLWSASTTPDGKDVTLGGAANKLPAPASRKLYTDVSATADLTSATNKLDTTNTSLTNTMLVAGQTYTTQHTLLDFYNGVEDGISCAGWYKDCSGNNHIVLGNPTTNVNCVNIASVTTCPVLGTSVTTTDRNNWLSYIRGVGADGQPRNRMGDMLNGKPVVVNTGATPTVFVSTNEGFLHAIDSSTGVEKWAFMPKNLLGNISTFYNNSIPKKHISGIDGAVSVWKFQYDSNTDGVINSADSYKTYLYFGLRQGGKEYYMIDITDVNTPKIVWHIDPSTTGFSELGYTWSKPAMAKMRVAHDSPEDAATHASDLIDVLVFGGGYDPVKNNVNTQSPAYTRPADSKGRNVYIVNAKTGALIWSLRDNVSGAAAKLLDSIPGDIRVLDMDRNGALDRLYFADTGGHIWRVDMDIDTKDGTVSPDTTLYNYTKASLSEFANLGGSGLNKRMFFYEPDVALLQSGGKAVLTLSIGSGYRTRPLHQGADRFYMLVDRNPFDAPDSGIFPITEDAKLVSIVNGDGTDNTSKLGTTGTSNDRLILTDTSLNGWYYSLPNTGEKVLAPAVTFLNKVVFTTFSADAGESTDPCESPPNSARAYVLDLFNGQAVADLDRVSGNERSVIAGVNEILDAAQIIFRAPSLADGTACTSANKDSCDKQYVEIRVGKMSLPLMGNDNASGAGVAGSVNIGNILPRMFWRDNNVSN
ncbi:MAG: PilC/PilY family type IV pilus protein [Thiothrix sp.]|uniref:PilC/PilY family type IV pilus protein n=1 Tax=Thiothrix sp. TaxID=1032 RepID=UPI0026365D86|nr:PilC/PilY family type IV pilus protein [Thiothrix sp.]MDD5395024.1 PilC/PilY family type IV pilus protein [Thiothrix sp.]